MQYFQLVPWCELIITLNSQIFFVSETSFNQHPPPNCRRRFSRPFDGSEFHGDAGTPRWIVFVPGRIQVTDDVVQLHIGSNHLSLTFDDSIPIMCPKSCFFLKQGSYPLYNHVTRFCLEFLVMKWRNHRKLGSPSGRRGVGAIQGWVHRGPQSREMRSVYFKRCMAGANRPRINGHVCWHLMAISVLVSVSLS